LHRSKYFENAIDALEKRLTASDLTEKSAAKQFSKEILDIIDELNESNISYWRREELRNECKKMKKKLDDAERLAKQRLANELLEIAKGLAEASGHHRVFVHKFPPGGNAKALDAAIKQLKSPLAMGFSIDPETNTVLCLAAVAQEMSEKLPANEWVTKVTEVIGGKGGGKATGAQAVGAHPDKVDEAIGIARQC